MAGDQIEVKVRRSGEFVTVKSGQLVPGDIMVVPNEQILPCDMILIEGSCVVNESMLTGESIPIVKSCITDSQEIYDPSDKLNSQSHTLFCGTKVLQTKSSESKDEILGLVIRTGYFTTKGQIIQEILFP